jgi:hypothetical protein
VTREPNAPLPTLTSMRPPATTAILCDRIIVCGSARMKRAHPQA